jgi:hypothetical protein
MESVLMRSFYIEQRTVMLAIYSALVTFTTLAKQTTIMKLRWNGLNYLLPAIEWPSVVWDTCLMKV